MDLQRQKQYAVGQSKFDEVKRTCNIYNTIFLFSFNFFDQGSEVMIFLR